MEQAATIKQCPLLCNMNGISLVKCMEWRRGESW